MPDKLSAEDRARFESAVRAHAAELYRYAYWLARDRQLAEDTVQEAFLRAWRSFREVRDEHSVRAWFYTIVRNEFYRLSGRDAGRPQTVDIEELEIADSQAGVFGMEIRDALKGLPAAYAEPLALQVLGGFSCGEIASMLATTEGAIMTRLTRARQALKKLTTAESVKVRRGRLA